MNSPAPKKKKLRVKTSRMSCLKSSLIRKTLNGFQMGFRHPTNVGESRLKPVTYCERSCDEKFKSEEEPFMSLEGQFRSMQTQLVQYVRCQPVYATTGTLSWRSAK